MNYQSNSPVLPLKLNEEKYTLPRMPHPMRRPGKSTAPGSTPTFTVSLKSLRNPPLDLSLSSQSLTTSILDLKKAVAESVAISTTEKIRLLYKKKPCSDSKTLKDVVGDEVPPGGEAEFSVMIIGGVTVGEKDEGAMGGTPDVVMGDTAVDEQAKSNTPVAQGPSGIVVLDSEEFWSDLRGFLWQRVRDQEVAERALITFKTAWKGSSPGP